MIMLFVKIFEEEVNDVIKGPLDRQPTKKRQNVARNVISKKKKSIKDPFKKDDELQKDFLQGLGLLIVKSQLPFVVCRKCLV